MLAELRARTAQAAYCNTAARFTRYLRESTRMRVVGAGPLRAGRVARVRVVLSKVSCVTLKVRRAGRVVATVVRILPRGQGAFFWRPARAGPYQLVITARDLAGHDTPAARVVKVRR